MLVNACISAYVYTEECGRMYTQERCFLLGLCLLGGVTFCLTAVDTEAQITTTPGELLSGVSPVDCKQYFRPCSLKKKKSDQISHFDYEFFWRHGKECGLGSRERVFPDVKGFKPVFVCMAHRKYLHWPNMLH